MNRALPAGLSNYRVPCPYLYAHRHHMPYLAAVQSILSCNFTVLETPEDRQPWTDPVGSRPQQPTNEGGGGTLADEKAFVEDAVPLLRSG